MPYGRRPHPVIAAHRRFVDDRVHERARFSEKLWDHLATDRKRRTNPRRHLWRLASPKRGRAYVYTGNKDEYRGDQELRRSDASKIAERLENGRDSIAPIQKAAELLDVVAVPLSKPTQQESVILEAAAPPSKPARVTDSKLVGIDGWLSLFALGLVFSPVLMAWTVFFNFLFLADRPASDLATALVIENTLLIAMMVFQVFVTVNFFRCRSTAPSLVIALLIARALFSLIDQILIMAVLKASPDAGDLIRSLVYVAVWIPYFLLSKRVKATFVHRGAASTYVSQSPTNENPVDTAIRSTTAPCLGAKNESSLFAGPAAGERITPEHPAVISLATEAASETNSPSRARSFSNKVVISAVGFAVIVALIGTVIAKTAEKKPNPEHASSWKKLIDSIGDPYKTSDGANSQSEEASTNPTLAIPLPADEVFARSSPAVVQVAIQDRQGHDIATGSAFLVFRGDLLVTNYHVINKAHAAHVILPNKSRDRGLRSGRLG